MRNASGDSGTTGDGRTAVLAADTRADRRSSLPVRRRYLHVSRHRRIRPYGSRFHDTVLRAGRTDH